MLGLLIPRVEIRSSGVELLAPFPLSELSSPLRSPETRLMAWVANRIIAMKKATRKSDVVDVPADNPVGTMDRFTEGLRRVMAAGKVTMNPPKRRKRKTRRGSSSQS